MYVCMQVSHLQKYTSWNLQPDNLCVKHENQLDYFLRSTARLQIIPHSKSSSDDRLCGCAECAGGAANDLGTSGDARRSGSVEPNSRDSQHRQSVLPALDHTLQQVLSTHFQQHKQVQQVDLLQNKAVIAITTETLLSNKLIRCGSWVETGED